MTTIPEIIEQLILRRKELETNSFQIAAHARKGQRNGAYAPCKKIEAVDVERWLRGDEKPLWNELIGLAYGLCYRLTSKGQLIKLSIYRSGHPIQNKVKIDIHYGLVDKKYDIVWGFIREWVGTDVEFLRFVIKNTIEGEWIKDGPEVQKMLSYLDEFQDKYLCYAWQGEEPDEGLDDLPPSIALWRYTFECEALAAFCIDPKSLWYRQHDQQ